MGEPAGQEVIVDVATPLKPRGGFGILYGNLAPEGCVVKLAGHGILHLKARPGCSNRRKRPLPPCRPARSRPATWW